MNGVDGPTADGRITKTDITRTPGGGDMPWRKGCDRVVGARYPGARRDNTDVPVTNGVHVHDRPL